jgi:hypothetical protein
MGTISKDIADRVIAGEFDDDRPPRSDFVINPAIYWERSPS